MSDDLAEEIDHLERLIATHHRAMRVYEQQVASFGSAQVPVHVMLGKEDTEKQLRLAQAELRRLRPGLVSERAPYLGLLTFQEEDADRFFGRDALVSELVEHVRHAPFLAVLGPSGSGKSSVVRAGMIPMLKDGALPGSENWRYLTLKPGAHPLDTLATELTRLQGGDLSDVLVLSRQLAETDQALLLAADLLLDRAASQRLVLVVDQAEELWTLAPAESEAREAFAAQQQRPFIGQLLAATAARDIPLLIILAMRADFLDRAIDQHRHLARAIADHDLFVSPMTEDELRAAIERPAEAAGVAFEPGLVAELVEQSAGHEGALPLLEYTLLELWKADSAGGMLTWATYRALGGVEGALAQTADTILAERYTAEQRDDLRAILLRLVQPGEGAADTRRRAALADLTPVGSSADAVQALLAPLVDARLLVVTTTHDRQTTIDDRASLRDGTLSSIVHRPLSAKGDEPLSSLVVGSSSTNVEVAHEALIRAWPTLRGWIDAARDDLRAQIQFEDAARDWETSGKIDDFLWSGLRLANAEAWIARANPHLNVRDQMFLDASRSGEQARIAEKAAAARRLRRLAAFLAGALVVAVIAAGAAGWFGIQSQRNAQNAEDRGATAMAAADLALARQLVAQAAANTGTDQGRALLLSLEANHITHEAAARSNLLHELLADSRSIGALTSHTRSVWSVAFSPDGTILASGSEDNSIRLWDVRTSQSLGDPLTDHTGGVRSVAFSPDGTILASGSDGSSLRLWDVRTRQPLGDPLPGHTGGVQSVAFSPDGRPWPPAVMMAQSACGISMSSPGCHAPV